MKTEHKTTVWDRIHASAIHHGAAIDEEIDRFSAGGYKSKFSAEKYIKGYQLSAPVVRILVDFYRPHLIELQEALAATDKELRECYRCNDRELKRYIDFIGSIVEACDKVVEKAVVQRKPRARKVKPPEVMVVSLKCLPDCPELGITGIPVKGLIGAQEAWFYDHAKRKLLRFKAADRDGLSVKGTTILNYDEKTSGARPVRKPAVFFKDLLIGCRGLLRVWNDIRGKITPIIGRTNDNMILLAVG